MSRCYGLYLVMCERLQRVNLTSSTHTLYQFYRARVELLNDSELPNLEWVQAVGDEKRDAVRRSRFSAKMLRLTAITDGKSSLLYVNDWHNHQMHRAAAEVLLDYYKEVRNAHVCA